MTRHQFRGAEDRGRDAAIWTAAPLALVATFFAARALPLHFRFPPNPMGIVSWATQNSYPPFQEVFWYGFSVAVATLVAWLLARTVARRRLAEGTQVALEGLGALALLGVVFFPASIAAALTASCALAAGLLLTRREEPGGAMGGIASDASTARLRLRGVAFALCALAVAALLSPGFWWGCMNVARGKPDEAFATDTWMFQAEWGQVLAWADAIWHGQAPGRDFYMLYGPLYPLGLVTMWKLLGHSVATWTLYYSSLNFLAVLAAIALASQVVSRRVLCLLLPITVLPIPLDFGLGPDLRPGLAFAGLACLVRAFERNSAGWLTLAGAVAGAGALFSQEFALAFLLSAAVALGIRARRRQALAFVVGFALGAAPCALWLAWSGAFAPMLYDLAAYPALVMAGFGKLPFESVVRSLPIAIGALDTSSAMCIRIGYATPAVCWAALLWTARIDRLDPRRPVASLRNLRCALASDPRRLAIGAVALFGLFAFRYALARSSFLNILKVSGAAAILLCVGVDRTLDAARRTPILAAWHIAALAGIALLGGFLRLVPSIAVEALRTTTKIALGIYPEAPTPSGNEEVLEVLRWIREHSDPADGVLFLPNNAAYYYLADRRSPIRFVLGHQMVTNTHRSETLARLHEAPPRFIVLSTGWKVDDIPSETYLGAAITSWIAENYVETTLIGSVHILQYRGPPT